MITGPAINPIVIDSDEPHPSLSDWHDYEPNLEFDDTELTHAPDRSQIVLDDEDFASGKWLHRLLNWIKCKILLEMNNSRLYIDLSK